MEYGYFSDGGKAYVVTTPFTPSPFTNKLFNDEYQIDISQRMEGAGICMAPDYSSRVHKDSDNHFYVTYEGKPYVL